MPGQSALHPLQSSLGHGGRGLTVRSRGPQRASGQWHERAGPGWASWHGSQLCFCLGLAVQHSLISGPALTAALRQGWDGPTLRAAGITILSTRRIPAGCQETLGDGGGCRAEQFGNPPLGQLLSLCPSAGSSHQQPQETSLLSFQPQPTLPTTLHSDYTQQSSVNKNKFIFFKDLMIYKMYISLVIHFSLPVSIKHY